MPLGCADRVSIPDAVAATETSDRAFCSTTIGPQSYQWCKGRSNSHQPSSKSPPLCLLTTLPGGLRKALWRSIFPPRHLPRLPDHARAPAFRESSNSKAKRTPHRCTRSFRPLRAHGPSRRHRPMSHPQLHSLSHTALSPRRAAVWVVELRCRVGSPCIPHTLLRGRRRGWVPLALCKGRHTTCRLS